MDPVVRNLAERHHGLLTTAQLRLAGTSHKSVRHWVAASELIRLTRGLYVLGDHYPRDRAARHLLLARGSLLLVPDGVLSHGTALLAHGIPVITVPPEVRLQRPLSPGVQRKGQVRRQGIVIDATQTPTTMTTSYGPTVPVGTAILQHAKARGVEEGLASADAAVRAALVPPRELREQASSDMGPHSRRARQVADLADGRIESVGESRLRFVCSLGGVDVVPQATIRDESGTFVARVDFRVRGTNVLLEFDGRVKYAAANGSALWDEKRREDRLRRLGYVVVRVVWADLADPMALIARIQDALLSERSSRASA
ncbi:MAG TPA: type IV toxin-antitoxin system AbiEi family antitoxin domain-containing protein [Ornithinicoccus sp.]|nr:type IV toxin-antitoxin system AbiEi family antitoxin domain-containing protein [Ornithinicoccus sp.]